MHLEFKRSYRHDRGEKGGSVLYSAGQLYDVSDEVADIVLQGDDPIAIDPDAPPQMSDVSTDMDLPPAEIEPEHQPLEDEDEE